MSDDRRLAATGHVHSREFDGEIVILDFSGGRYFSLDEIGTRIWKGLVDGATPREIATAIASEFAVDPERALADVTSLVDELIAKGLVAIRPPSSEAGPGGR